MSGAPTEKGWPVGRTPAEAIAAGLHVDELPLPVLVLREDAIAHNLAAMARWCADEGLLLAPHGKTTMAPQLFRRQLDAGAWAMTVATVQQARVALDAGAPRVLIANQLADPDEVRWVAEQSAEILFLVDSLAGVAIAEAAVRHAAAGVGVAARDGAEAALRDAAAGEGVAARLGAQVAAGGGERGSGSSLSVLVEVGYDGGRAGARSLAEALVVARAVAAAPGLRLAGVEAFEGLLGTLAAVDALLGFVGEVARAAAGEGLLEPEPILSAGGSAFYDRVAALLKPVAAELGGRVVLRSGCYVTHDHGLYERQAPGPDRLPGGPRFEPAIEVWAQVLSRPEPGRAILGAGRRDLSYDSGLPVRLDGPGRVVALNDQHAHVELDPGDALAVGDVVRLGISHPCTALERWRLIPVADASGRVIDATATHF